ncbi:MAG: hypothetical protein K2I51_03610, partial [Muribaculaceae bacterium]|nr:hypothetical protein [Muribaculaceae bacterium]
MNPLLKLIAATVPAYIALAPAMAQTVTEFPATKLKKETITLPLDTALRRQSAEVRAAVGSNPAHGKANWSATILDSDGIPLCRATVSWGETGFDDAFSRRYLRLSVDTADASGRLLPASHYDRYENVDLHRGANSLAIDITGSRVAFAVGNDLLVHAGEAHMPRPGATISVTGDRTLRVDHAAVKSYPRRKSALITSWTTDSLAAYFSSAQHLDPIEGVWTFLDRDNDPRWALPGGFYTLAIVRSGNNPEEFDILYLSGARTNSTMRKACMLKGRLTSTRFLDHYL